MKRWTTHWTTAIAAAALFALPPGARAQTPAAAQTPASAAAQTSQAATPEEHLRQAEAALNSISAAAVTGKAKTRIAELKQHLNALERADSGGAAKPSAKGTSGSADAKWSTEVAAVDRILSELIGPETTTGASGTPGATGTSGSTAVTIDDETRQKLTDVRTHVTAYAAAKSGPAPSPATSPDQAATAAAAAAAREPATTAATQPPSSTQPPSAATQPPSATSAATPPSSAAAQQTQTPEQQPAAQQPSQDEARRHLTMARDSLSQMTQLPAASQLQGETRAQVSQLITNFNELITTNSDWKAAYAKLDANLTALLGGPSSDEPPTAATSATGTPGAVGTAGSSGLDPALRAKLVEFRAHLKDFEKAAGGAAAASAAPSASPSSGATSTPPSGSTSTPPAASAAMTPETSAAASDPAAAQEAAQHIHAIEAILAGSAAGATATPNTPLMLDRAQLDELRRHLGELKKIVEKK